MIGLKKIKEIKIKTSRVQDILFLIIIFAFSTILILGLFPKTDTMDRSSSSLFYYSLMSIPILAAIYFIVISFKRKFYPDTSEISSSIRLKIAIAFIFVAILPSLPIILILNNIINTALTELISEKTTDALEESLIMSKDAIISNYKGMESELKSLDYSFRNILLKLDSIENREFIAKTSKIKGYNSIFYKIVKKNYTYYNTIQKVEGGDYSDFYLTGISKFLKTCNLQSKLNVYNISIGKNSLLVGKLCTGNNLIVIYQKNSEKIISRISIYKDSLKRYQQRELLKHYLQKGIGVLLLILSILIIIISIVVSIFLSGNITKPILKLVDSARKIASGNFNVNLERKSSDELALLFSSFNNMAKQLAESREIIYQTQKFEAWRDVVKRILHEIKNPLTPIRLSAERIQKRFKEKHPDIENIVISGTETITEEIKVLMRILGEFSEFTRLPKMKPGLQGLNSIIINTITLFQGHEEIIFHIDMDDSIPDIYLDKILIRQALTNLLHNSIDAIENQGNIYVKSKLIEKGQEGEEGEEGKKIVRIWIRDDGIGISQDDIEKIFKPTFSRKEHGTGLGLTIVEKIILEHKGKIYCESRQGEGTSFIIDLPIIQEGIAENGKNIDN